MQPPRPQPEVQLTAAGLPRKKPGRKPGSVVKPKIAADGSTEPKTRKPRKPRDPNAPPIQRKRKNPPATDAPATDAPATDAPATDAPAADADQRSASGSAPARQPKITELASMRMDVDSRSPSAATQEPLTQKVVKREAIPESMRSLLNRDPSPPPPPVAPVRPGGMAFDPVRSSSYDPVRETMLTRDPYAAPSVPSVAKIAEPLKPSNPTLSGLANPQVASSAPSKKVTSMQQQDRKEKKASSASSSPKMNGLKSGLSDVPDLVAPGSERSILDFGKVKPGDESSTPSIVLHIPLNGETNKYVNFMRLAEEQYGWDALHPRLAAHRERKARIAAASAALEKQGSGRESGDEMSVDLQSDGEGSNVEMGGMGNGGTSGPDGAPAKPARKKRNFKEDEYDKDDDFVDDSEMLWEEQAAASRDGFFVYSGPLVPEVEKPTTGHDGPPKRGRGGRGRGSRGGRGGLSRDASAAAATGEGGEPVVKRRGGGPGSRGGSVARKPRITKLEKAQMASEKAEREKLASMSGKNGSSYSLLQGGSSPSSFAAGMVVDR
ncbi:putative histone promoter control 2 protein [Phaeoacremonium minimum UCRPA7]|uniref:Putative histone promoter control 2 protein n=1 Tax=Phaeoacremonium minimum (strain UCR-PA7) TaxID=1286976 RepID=R8BDF2_PHAM7|nr:putative histone promoter control 2 protein [Phaeoacremonium minimum UCRPA7]EON97331.1 putative histone promoter control 2 protein [Phaeoacremonium minimum UCRPA7]